MVVIGGIYGRNYCIIRLMIVKDTPIQAPYTPTSADEEMAHSIQYMASAIMHGEVESIGVCARMRDGSDSCFFLDPDLEGLTLSEPIQKLRSMYELNQLFRQQTTAPPQNRTYREH